MPCSDERAGEKETEAMCVLNALQIIHSEQREGNFEIHAGKIEQRLCIFVLYPEEGSTPHPLTVVLLLFGFLQNTESWTRQGRDKHVKG